MKILITQDTDWIKKGPQEEVLKRYMSDHKSRKPSLMSTFEESEITKEQVDEVLEKYRGNAKNTQNYKLGGSIMSCNEMISRKSIMREPKGTEDGRVPMSINGRGL